MGFRNKWTKKAAKIDLLKNGPNNELKFVWQAGGGTAWALKPPDHF